MDDDRNDVTTSHRPTPVGMERFGQWWDRAGSRSQVRDQCRANTHGNIAKRSSPRPSRSSGRATVSSSPSTRSRARSPPRAGSCSACSSRSGGVSFRDFVVTSRLRRAAEHARRRACRPARSRAAPATGTPATSPARSAGCTASRRRRTRAASRRAAAPTLSDLERADVGAHRLERRAQHVRPALAAPAQRLDDRRRSARSASRPARSGPRR